VLTYKMAIALRPQICDVTSPYVYTNQWRVTTLLRLGEISITWTILGISIHRTGLYR